MPEGTKELLTLLGGLWVFMNFSLKLRDQIDLLRNRIVFQLDDDFIVHDKEVRLWMLHTDIDARAGVLIFLILLTGILLSIVGVGAYFWLEDADDDLVLRNTICTLYGLFAVLAFGGGGFTAYSWRRDREYLKSYIDSDKKHAIAPEGEIS